MMFLRPRVSRAEDRAGAKSCLLSFTSAAFVASTKAVFLWLGYNQRMRRSAIIFTMLAGLLSAADSKVDHVTIAGSDLKQMQARLAAVGIASVYGGAHSNHATEMALVSFPDGSYLELMGIPANADAAAVAAHVWGKFLRENAGPTAWAMRTRDLAEEVKRLKAAGVAVGKPVSSGRQRPDGVQLEWETSDVGAGPAARSSRF